MEGINVILALGLIVVLGFFGGLALEKLKFPRITGYIIIGVLLSPSLLNVISIETIGELGVINDIALGLIAYLIGGSLHWESVRKVGKSIAAILPFQSLGAWFLVTLVLALLGHLIIPSGTFWQTYFPIAFIIGAVSCATAPAATMAIISEYKAKGPLTTTLLAVVALDDAIAVVAFAIALGICQPLVNGLDASAYQILAIPLLQIFKSVAIGVVFAIALIYMARLVKTRYLLLVVVFGMIMLCAGITSYLGVSAILANMVVGFIVVNKTRRQDMFTVVEGIEDVIFAMFFVLAGLHFDLSVMRVAGILAVLIVLARCVGKYAGTRAGARISHAPDTIKKYLGFALLPQAGVAIGLGLIAAIEFPSFGIVLLNGILAAVIINELITPPLTKYAIFKAGEARVDSAEKGS